MAELAPFQCLLHALNSTKRSSAEIFQGGIFRDNYKRYIPIPLVRTGRSELLWENSIMYILVSVRIFYTDDEDSGVPMTPALGD
jgi:hypothetical protein